MLLQFVQGLERYENGDWSASRLPDALITTEEIKAARRNEGRKEEPEDPRKGDQEDDGISKA